jgi:hypothetical protein
MVLQEDNFGETKEIFPVSWMDIEKSLKGLDDNKRAFIILTDDTGSYLQCAGGQERLVIEFRKYNSNDFKHYIIGMGEIESPMKSIWISLNCKVGPITVMTDEVLTVKQAEVVFRGFFETQEIPERFKKRNVSKLHKK